MSRILVVWEDAHWQSLRLVVNRRLPKCQSDPQRSFPSVMFHTAKGNGNFERYVSVTWRNAARNGLPTSPGPIDHLVCVADGDRLHEVLASINPPPKSAPEVAAWHLKAEAEWQAYLRGLCDPSLSRDTVHSLILRWSKESLVLAGYDQAPLKEHLGIDSHSAEFQHAVAECSPPVATVAEGLFTDSYQRPLVCLGNVQEALRHPSVHKNSPEIDDALKDLANSHLDPVCRRVPDIDRLVDLLWRLSN
jgi:hypothetical protein